MYSAAAATMIRPRPELSVSDDKLMDINTDKAPVIRKDFPESWIWNSFDQGY